MPGLTSDHGRIASFHGATLSGTVDPRRFTPRHNFGAGGQRRRLVEVDRHYDDSEVIWQDDVYAFARTVADRLCPDVLIDLGTGTGSKFGRWFGGHAARRVQVDWHDQRVGGEDEGSSSFLAANLEDPTDLAALEALVPHDSAVLFVLSDVIEHLSDPRNLLRCLRLILKRHPNSRLVISTPDRERTDGRDAHGLPDNSGHVRQWTLNEFGLAMLSAGFVLRRIGRVPQNAYDTHHRTICGELSCSDAEYEAWLHTHCLPAPSPHLVVTTEHARTRETGGIGTYIQLAEEIEQEKRLLLFCGTMGLPNEGWSSAVRHSGWLHVADLCGRGEARLEEIGALDYEEILDATLQVVFLYDALRLIEYQDYRGIGHRIAQAKRAGMLPDTIRVLAYVHGNHLYLDAAAGALAPGKHLSMEVRERLSVELADIVAFPSRYIRDLYVNQAGFQVREELHLPCPFLVDAEGLDELSRGPIRTLVFFGKQTTQKGYPEFVDSVLALFADRRLSDLAGRIRRIVLMGVAEPDPRLKSLNVAIEHGVWSRSQSVSMLRRLAADSLVVLPYKGDNHPLSVLEVVDSDCQILAFEAGGIPEELPKDLHGRLLCAPNTNALTAGIAQAMRLSHWDRCELVRRTREMVREAYREHAQRFRETMSRLRSGVPRRARAATPGAVTVVIPNRDGDPTHLSDAARGLRNSFHRPAGVLLIDDASTPEGLRVLEASAAAFGDIPTALVALPENRGLAGARNAGLARVASPYVCAHDNDNIVLNDYLGTACRILDENPEVAAVTCWSWYFDDGANWERAVLGHGYRPLGADLGMGLRLNVLGDALAVYRVSALREIGGWNDAARAKWEDWELFVRLVAAGKQVWVIPREQMLYRVRPGSMLRSYADFPGWLRLASAVPQLPRNQAVALLRSMWTPSFEEGGELQPYAARSRASEDWACSLQHRLDGLCTENQAIQTMLERAALPVPISQGELSAELLRLRGIEQSTIWRATAPLRRVLDAYPHTKRRIRAMLSAVWRGGRTLRRAMAA